MREHVLLIGQQHTRGQEATTRAAGRATAAYALRATISPEEARETTAELLAMLGLAGTQQ